MLWPFDLPAFWSTSGFPARNKTRGDDLCGTAYIVTECRCSFGLFVLEMPVSRSEVVVA